MRFIDTEEVTVITKMPDDNEVVIVGVEGTVSDPTFIYETSVKIDLRHALESNIDKLTVKLLKVPFEQTITSNAFNQSLNSSLPQDVNTLIASYREADFINFITNDAFLTLDSQDIDFTTILNTQLANRFNELTDEELFGTEPVVITEPENNRNRFFRDLAIPLSAFKETSNDGNKISFSQAIDMLYQLGHDPASAFFHEPDELSFIESYGGLTLPSYYDKSSGSDKVRYLKKAIRAAYLSAVDDQTTYDLELLSRKNPNSSRFKTYKINGSLRFQDVTIRFKIKKSQLAATSNSSLNIAITAQNFLGIILDVRYNVYTHKGKTGRAQLEKPDIQVKAIRSGVNSNIPLIDVTNNSANKYRIRIYHRITNECGSYRNTVFSQGSTERIILPGRNVRFKTYAESANNSNVTNANSGAGKLLNRVNTTVGSILFRVVAQSMSSNITNTFYDRIQSTKPERNHFVPIICSLVGEKIRISLYNIPGTVSEIGIVKRNLTKHEKTFTPLVTKSGVIITRGAVTRYDPIEVQIKEVGQLDDNTISFDDVNVHHENVYEYKAVLYFGGEDPVETMNSGVAEYLRAENIVTLTPSAIQSVNNGYINFNCNVRRQTTIVDNIFQRISGFFAANTPSSANAALFSLFEDSFSSLTSILDKYIDVVVRRHDTLTGESKIILPSSGNPSATSHQVGFDNLEVGTFTVDDYVGSTKDRRFIYELQPRILATYDVITDTFKVLDDLSQQLQQAGLDSGFTEQIREIGGGSSVMESTANKYFTRLNKNQSTLQGNSEYLLDCSGDIMYYGRTSDIVYVTHKTPGIEFNITNQMVTVEKSLPQGTYIESVTLTDDDGIGEINSQLPASGYDPNHVLPPTKYGKSITSIRRSVKSKFNDLVVISFDFDGDELEVDFIIIYATKNSAKGTSSNIICAEHLSKDNGGSFTYIDDSQINFTGAITYFAQPVFENKKLGGVSKLGVAIVGNRKAIG